MPQSNLLVQPAAPGTASVIGSRRKAPAGAMSASRPATLKTGETSTLATDGRGGLRRRPVGQGAGDGRGFRFRRDRRARRACSTACPGRSICRRQRSDRIEAASDCELAICSAPAMRRPAAARDRARRRRHADPRHRAPTRATSATSCPRRATAESLLVVEVITPGGHWSSYPPHKHDRDALPDESYARGDLLPPPLAAAGLRLPARLHRRPLASTRRCGRRRRRGAGAARLPSGRRAARLRPLLSQRHGRPEAHLALPQRPGARVADESGVIARVPRRSGTPKQRRKQRKSNTSRQPEPPDGGPESTCCSRSNSYQ